MYYYGAFITVDSNGTNDGTTTRVRWAIAERIAIAKGVF
jgi:hypothetical protein